MAKMKYDDVLSELKTRKNSIKRSTLIKLLKSIGFTVRPGTSGAHFTYTHKAFVVHPGGTFNGEHKKDAIIKLPYILDAIKILTKHETELREFLGEKE